MKLSSTISALINVCLFQDAISFTASHSNLLSPSRSTSLFHHAELDPSWIKKAGAGVATKPPGGNSSFDPNENGKLQGTGNCNERVQKGASYGMTPSGSSGGGVPSKAPTSNLTSLVNSKSQY
jgi:hypothetical protein